VGVGERKKEGGREEEGGGRRKEKMKDNRENQVDEIRGSKGKLDAVSETSIVAQYSYCTVL
jgi:hypothetical protein